jgi:predicted nucleic acid-binding protein
MYLLDTNVVSELRRQRPHGALLAWLHAVEDGHLHLATDAMQRFLTAPQSALLAIRTR